jgi:uncharacterized protein with FMN-binding domain
MKNIRTKALRAMIQAITVLILIISIAVYNLYTSKLLNFKILGIGDLNPYGGWSAVREFATDSSYIFEGISKSIALTIALVVMTILGGRFFCGWLCPLGAMQDLAAWFGDKVKAPKYKEFSIKGFSPLLLKYPILLTILLISIFGYGARIAGFSPWRALLSLPKLTSAWDEMKLGFIILAGIFSASIFLSRLFCRYLCPLGAAQALFGYLSILSLKYNKGCDSCNSCLDACPAGIRLSSTSNAISPECIRCLNCAEECKVGKGNRIHLRIGNRNVSVITYATLMLVLFIGIWLGVPKLWIGSSHSENILSGTLKDGTYQGEAKGFAGKIITEVNITEGKITNIEVIKHQESKGWYEEVFMVLPKEMIENQGLNIDGISGATKSSKGFIKSVETAVKKAKK